MSQDLLTLMRGTVIDDLERFGKEVRQVAEGLTEQELWTRPLEPSNSVGHLILHLTGNLSHFVGAQLGNTGYVRDRDREFVEPNPPDRATALAHLDAAVATFRRVVENLSAEQLAAPHPEKRFSSIYQALVYLLTHFAMHRGQMSYIARLVKSSSPKAAA